MNRKKLLTVEDLMTTAVITMKESDTLSSVDLEMHLAEVRHIPVVDDRGHVVGIVSDRDVLRSLAKSGGKPLHVTEVMTRGVRTTRAGVPAHEAARVMLEHRIGCLPVVGDGEQLMGIVTETDFLVVAQRALAGHDVTHRSPAS